MLTCKVILTNLGFRGMKLGNSGVALFCVGVLFIICPSCPTAFCIPAEVAIG